MANKPLSPAGARRLLRDIYANGRVVFTRHAREELQNDGRSEDDARNVLRAGLIHNPAEWENDSWRYRVETPRFCCVVEFDSDASVVVVTFWEKKR